jgi:AraC family transcriptional regulator, regulatory protein of adaptative response / methylated-DNA-[protein]-cysteine methyltransferase
MSPGEFKTGGAGLIMSYGFHPSPFGKAIVVTTQRGLAGLGFADPGGEPSALADMQRRWPRATFASSTPAPGRTASRSTWC